MDFILPYVFFFAPASPPKGFSNLNACREPHAGARFEEAPALGDKELGVSAGALWSSGLGATYSRNSHQPPLTCVSSHWLRSFPPWKPSRISVISFPEALFGWGFLEGISQAGIIKERYASPGGWAGLLESQAFSVVANQKRFIACSDGGEVREKRELISWESSQLHAARWG